MSQAEIRSDFSSVNKALPMIAWVACLIGACPIGVILAYIDRSKTSEVYATHYTYLIRTFWIGLLLLFTSLLLSVVAIGFITWFATILWYLIRCVKGLVLLVRDEPIPNPATWLV
jgi:uncharacterized membrane protein